MTKKELIARWHIVQKRLEKLGVACELDMLGLQGFTVQIATSQRGVIGELIEWAFQEWKDVKSTWQNHDDSTHYFGMAFLPAKEYVADPDKEDD